MKNKLFVSLLACLCAMVFSSTLHAGVEPSPFQPEINMIWAAEKGMNSCLDRVDKVLAMPPDDIEPSPNLSGAVNRLEAIEGQVNSLNNFVMDAAYSVMGFDPSPFRLDLIPALEAVAYSSQSIVNLIGDFVPPDPVHPDFLNALDYVQDAAAYMTDNIMIVIDELNSGMMCSAYTDQFTCREAGCVWVVPDGALPYCTQY